MHTKPEPTDPDVLDKMGYDRRDLDVPAVRKATIYTTVGCIACYFIAVFIYNLFIDGSLMHVPKDVVPSRNAGLKGQPELQDNITTKIDISRMRADEDQKLNHYSWADQSAGTARMPIDEAMRSVAKNGVSTGNVVPAKTTGNTIKLNTNAPTP
ncbi:MAG: hypothetical protein WCK51_04465 [Armatimonadota bacterium]